MADNYSDRTQRLKWLTDDRTADDEMDSVLKRIWDLASDCPEEDTLLALNNVLDIINPQKVKKDGIQERVGCLQWLQLSCSYQW